MRDDKNGSGILPLVRSSDKKKPSSGHAKHLLFAVRIVLIRESLDNPWQNHRWRLVDLVPLEVTEGDGTPPAKAIPIRPLRKDETVMDAASGSQGTLFCADASIDLHRAEAEAYAENLASAEPSIFVVLREDDPEEESSEAGIHLEEVSLSPYTIQDYEDTGEDQIEKIPLQGPLQDLVKSFVSQYYQPEAFIKRKRDRVKTDSEKDQPATGRTNLAGDIFRPPTSRRLN